jgi:phosphoesterase RecJ-like protein
MAEILESLKKKFNIYLTDKPGGKYKFLPNLDQAILEKKKIDFSFYDLIIICDCGSIKRTDLADEIINRPKRQTVIEFDHHRNSEMYADLEARDEAASSSTEMIYRFIAANGLEINKNLATAILAGILTDTGNFLYQYTSDKSFKISSEMIKAGASFPKIYKSAWRDKRLASLKIWGKAMKNIRISKTYGIAYTILTGDDLANNAINDDEMEGLINFLGNICGVRAVLIIREEKSRQIKGSFRSSHPSFDTSRLANALGGGGHAKSSAFMIEGRLEEVDGKWKVL